MKNITREIRGAYISLLSNLQYNSVTIPVRSGIIGSTGAEIPIGGDKTFESYILITNQYRGSNALKNGLNHNTFITVDINTVFSGSSYNSAGSEWVEEISDLVFDRLYEQEVFRLREFGIGTARFIVTSNSNSTQPMPVQYTDTSRVFRCVIVFEIGIQELTNPVDEPNLWIKTIDNV